MLNALNLSYGVKIRIVFCCRHDAEVQELSSKVVALETELSRANDLLAAAKGRTLPLSDTEILSLSPSVSRASAMLKSGTKFTIIAHFCLYVWLILCTCKLFVPVPAYQVETLAYMYNVHVNCIWMI